MMNMKKVLLMLCNFLFLIHTTSAFSIKIESLYSAKIPVNTQSEQERIQSIQQALNQVLIKVSGDDKIINNDILKSRLKLGTQLIQELTYTNTPGNKQPFLLELHFDGNAINQWLRDASAPIWGQNRPLILSLIIYTSEEYPGEIISTSSSDSSNRIVTLLNQNAERRGLPIIFPLMDLTDITQITVKDVLNQELTPNINLAEKRYSNDAFLFGNVTRHSNQLSSHWKLILGNDQWEWNLTGKTEADVLSALIDNITDTLTVRFAIVTTHQIQNSLQLKITNIRQQSDFVQLIRYLNHLTPVANVCIVEIAGNEITLKINLRSTQQAFMQAIALGKQLISLPSNTDTSAQIDNNTSLFIYQWNPL